MSIGAIAALAALSFIVLLTVVVFYLHHYCGGVPYVSRVANWSVGIYTGDAPFRLEPAARASNPVLTLEDVDDVEAGFVADPFMISTEDGWLMFFEILDMQTARGVIGYAESTDGLSWQYGGVALREPFHLSYPQVFRHDNRVYMLPEASGSGQVRLYRGEPAPDCWELDQVLLDEPHVDPTVLYHQGHWWLFLATADSCQLRLVHSESLKGPYKEHPCSPIVRDDPSRARPAGGIVRTEERLFRICQSAVPTYGAKVLAVEIEEMTQNSYRERTLEDALLEVPQAGWNSGGVHHMDAHELPSGRWIACVDGWSEVRVVWGRQW